MDFLAFGRKPSENDRSEAVQETQEFPRSCLLPPSVDTRMMAQPTTEAPYPISDNVPDTPEDQPKPGKPLVGPYRAVPETREANQTSKDFRRRLCCA